MRNLILLFIIFGLTLVGCDLEQETLTSPAAEQFNKDLQEIDNYLNSQGITATVDLLSGIRYVIDEQGDGLKPIVVDSLTVTYTNSILTSGIIVEEVVQEKIRSSQLLDGIATISTFLQEGGRVTAYIPSAYMYGPFGNDAVPGNVPIIAELQLNALHNQQLMDDIAIISDSLAKSDTVSLIHPTGIRYFLNQGDGDSPTVINSVQIDYSGKIFNGKNADIIFDQAKGATFNLQNLIIGWQIMIPEMRVGGELTMILPSSFAYGPAGISSSNPPIAPNEILVFNVTLIDFN